jgi:hypothetical protein
MYKDTPPDQCPPRIRDLIVLDPRTWNFTDSFALSTDNLFENALSNAAPYPGTPAFQFGPLPTFTSGSVAGPNVGDQYGYSSTYHSQSNLLPDWQPTHYPTLLGQSLQPENHKQSQPYRPMVRPRPIQFNRQLSSAGGIPCTGDVGNKKDCNIVKNDSILYASDGGVTNGNDTAENDGPKHHNDSNDGPAPQAHQDVPTNGNDTAENNGPKDSNDGSAPQAHQDVPLPRKSKPRSILGTSESQPINSGPELTASVTGQTRRETRSTKTRGNRSEKENALSADKMLGDDGGKSTRGQRKRKVEAIAASAALGGGGKRTAKRLKTSG